VAKVRMQSLARELGTSGKMPSPSSVYASIYRNEGFFGFYRGIQPNIFRNICVNVGEMASYDQFKQMFLMYTSIPDKTPLHFICGFMAGFVATIVASPADVVKTRLMSSPDSYSGFVNCFTRMVAEEGPFAFYKGFVPNFFRLSLWSITCFIAMEKIKRFLLGPSAIKKKE
jgi:solute carrier family 25 uncoupling protein 8/9